MSNSKKIFSIIFLVLYSLSAYAAKTNDILLAPRNTIETNRFFRKVIESPQTNIEKNKIYYLIERMRQSPYAFIRNGEPHTGKQAAAHIVMKYQYGAGRIKTAQDFIEGVAAKSMMTSAPYLVLIDGEKYKVRDILYNELSLLQESKTEVKTGSV